MQLCNIENRHVIRRTLGTAGFTLLGVVCLPSHALAQSGAQSEVPKIVAHEFGSGNPSELYLPEINRYIPSLPANYVARPYLGDGFLGIRPNPNPLSQSETVAAGYVFTNPKDGYEMASPAPYPLGTDIRVNGSSVLSAGELHVQSQTLDMSDGELVTEMTFTSAEGLQLDIEVTQFLARSVPSLMCQEIRLKSSGDASVEIAPEIQREGVPGTVYRDKPLERTHVTQLLGMESDRGSKIGIALLIAPEKNLERREDGVYVLSLKQGEEGVFRTIAAVVTSAYDPAPDLQAIRVASWGEMLGFDELRERNRAAWKELWKSRVVVTGDETAQQALDAAFFYLHSSAHSGLLTGVPPFGASQWLNYSGHVFWDMDAWILPAVLPADPAAAKAMVRFRYEGLKAAEDKAASFGFEGAMYPWEAGLDGSEVTPAWANTGWVEQHVVLEVAVAAWEYYEATGDAYVLHHYVWPIENQVAEWIIHRGVFTARGFEIQNIMGHNEGVANVANDSMVNLLCKMALSGAIKAARAAGEVPPPTWTRVEEAIYIPVDTREQIVLPFSLDSPYLKEHPEAYTLSNLQMLVFHDPPVSFALFKRTWEYEEGLRAHRSPSGSVPGTVRSPGFINPPLAVCAAMFGDRKKAAEVFHLATEYQVAPFLLSKEYRPFLDGNYLMNQASLLMAAMYGFTGLRISEGDWRTHPVSLPEGWTRIEIQRIWVHGKPFHLIAEQGKTAVLTPIPDGP